MLCLYLKILLHQRRFHYFCHNYSPIKNSRKDTLFPDKTFYIGTDFTDYTVLPLGLLPYNPQNLYIPLLGAYDDKRIVIFLEIILRQHIFLQQSGIDNENIFTFLRDMVGP